MEKFKLLLLVVILFLTACQQDIEYMENNRVYSDIKKDRIYTIKTLEKSVSTRAVALKDKCWQAGDTIKIKFLNGDLGLQQSVQKYAALWLKYANLYFKYVDPSDSADVKIGFDYDERWISWAYIGTDCKKVPQNEPSLNLIWLQDGADSITIKGEVLRGFGHVLGLGFEHLNPTSPIVFKPTIRLTEEYNISAEDSIEIATLYNTFQSNYTAYDKYSVMILPISRNIITNPRYATNTNYDLSENDRGFISKLYPYKDTIVKIKAHCINANILLYTNDSLEISWGDGVKEIITPTIDEDWFSFYQYRDTSEHDIFIIGKNTDLITFSCCNMEISSLDVSNNKQLETLFCRYNRLSNLDLSKNISLKFLEAMNNQLDKLVVDNNINLKSLMVDDNRLSSLDVSKNINLINIACSNNRLTRLDLSKNPLLYTIMCHSNDLLELNVKNNINLEYIQSNSNPFIDNEIEFRNFLSSIPYNTDNRIRYLYISRDEYFKRIDMIQEILLPKGWSLDLIF